MDEGISIAAEPEVAAAIEARLLQSLRAELPQAHNSTFTLAARDAAGTLVGGLHASTSYSWLLVKTLWVDRSHRGQGLGTRLMNAAQEEGRKLGCHAAWLDTSNPQARIFYEGLGYEVFGIIENGPGEQPESYRRWFMKKRL